MAKSKNKTAAAEAPATCNWELVTEFPGVKDGATVRESLDLAFQQLDQELKEGNPVWHWALCDDHCTFVFRDGRKVVIGF